MIIVPLVCCFFLGLAEGNVAEVDRADSVLTSTLSPDEQEIATAKSGWVHLFFGLSRRPQNGSMTLVFPGFFGTESDDWVVAAGAEKNPRFIHSNDSRLFRRNLPYVFDEIDALDEDARQRRLLLAAGNRINLLEANEEFISTLVDGVFSTPRDSFTNETSRTSVVRYITNKMRSFGLVTGNQIYDPQEFSEMFDGLVPNGTNVIGILPGQLWGTNEDEILVIGAHWDTFPSSNGMDDNGSGVTALLEVARAVTEASCRPRTSVIFVAFDLEEMGCLGSIYFIRNFLVPNVLVANGAKLKGAFILDTIMNFNDTQFSQTLSPEWQQALPEFWTQIQAENQTGDFLTALYRKDVDLHLAETFAHHWSNGQGSQNVLKDPKSVLKRPKPSKAAAADVDDVEVETIGGEFRLKKVRLDVEAEVEQLDLLLPWMDLLRSDHSRFWYHNLEDYHTSLPAVLITDTGPYRGVMQECYHKACDSSAANKELKFANKKFLTKTCQVLIDSTVSLSRSVCHQLHPVERHREPDVSGDRKPTLTALLAGFITILQWFSVQFTSLQL